MTINLALEYIPRRMKELGYGNNYYIRFKHYVLNAGEKREINAHCQFLILVEEIADVRVESDFGFFDLSYSNVNELTYEHQGKITLTNQGAGITRVHFIQVIPKQIKKTE